MENIVMTEKMKDLIWEYKIPLSSTPERLEESWGKLITFGNRIILAGYSYRFEEDCYFAAIYEFVTEDHTVEGGVKLINVSDKRFMDDGHAIEWAIMQK